MSQSLEYGPVEKPIPVDDVSTSYVRISAGAGQVFPKTLTYDTALIVGREHAYHPVKAYLEKCAAETDPCPYFDTLATELLGVKEDTMTDCQDARRQPALRHHHEALPHRSRGPCPRAWLRP